MKSKILSVILILSLIVSSSSIVFAAEGIDGEQIIAEAQADIVEDVVGTDDVCTNIDETRKDFVVEGETLEVEIPKDGDDEIVMESTDGEEISMGLPEEVEKSDAVVTDEGTIVYDSNEEVSVSVQATQELQGDLVIEGVRSLVVIEDASAPKEYSFDYDLPKGYRLITSEEYNGEENTEPGWIYVIDTNTVFIDDETEEEFYDIVAVIEPAWAKDANGDSLPTSYKINGSTLTQVVEFNNRSAFPIVADPKTTSKPKSVMVKAYSDNFTISHTAINAGTWTTTGLIAFFEKKIEAGLIKCFGKSIGKKLIPIFGTVMWAVDGYCLYRSFQGYNYTVVQIYFEKWKTYKRQASKWVSGYSYKYPDIDLIPKK